MQSVIAEKNVSAKRENVNVKKIVVNDLKSI